MSMMDREEPGADGNSAHSREKSMRISPEHIEVLRERFSDFYDGVVKKVDLEVGIASRVCRVEVQCKDRDSRSGWSRVTFLIRDVKEFRFELGRTTFEVLSGGLQFVWQADRVYVIVDAYPDDGPGLPDLTRTAAYVAGADCEWSYVEEPDA